MSTVSLDPMSSIMGPKHDTRDDMNKTNINTDNELLPGLNIAHLADPEAKGSIAWEPVSIRRRDSLTTHRTYLRTVPLSGRLGSPRSPSWASLGLS